MSKTPALYIKRRKEDGSLGDLEPAFGEGDNLEMLLVQALEKNVFLEKIVESTNSDLEMLMEIMLTRGII